MIHNPFEPPPKFLNPAYWSIAAIICSISFFALLPMMLHFGLGAKPDPDTGIDYLLYLLTSFLFLIVFFIGPVVCIVALVIDASYQRWDWFSFVLLPFFLIGILILLFTE